MRALLVALCLAGAVGLAGHQHGGGGGDNSNAQFAVLALYDAERAGVKVKQRTWELALDYWKRAQNQDGSWG